METMMIFAIVICIIIIIAAFYFDWMGIKTKLFGKGESKPKTEGGKGKPESFGF